MRLSEWGAMAPIPAAAGPNVLAVAEATLATLGATPDPHCWVAWGEDPGVRWVLLAATPAGLVTVHVRVIVLLEGPRAAGKLIRWPRVQLGDVQVEVQGVHRIISATVEGVILRGVDAEADAVGAFLQGVFAAIDGRPSPVQPGRAPATPVPSPSATAGA